MYSSGVTSDFDFAQIAAPSVSRLASAPGFSTISIGTATAPECSLTMRSILEVSAYSPDSALSFSVTRVPRVGASSSASGAIV